MSNEILTPIQIEAINYINISFNNNINPICSTHPGSGKTRIACEIIKQVINNNIDKFRILIIHKASNYEDPWLNHLDASGIINKENSNDINYTKFAHIHGKDRYRFLINGKYFFPFKSILFYSYETICLDIANNYFYLNEYFDLIIFDEIHTIINSKKLTKKSKNIYMLNGRKILALTATPIQNYTEELGFLFLFLNEKIVYKKLIDMYNNHKEYNKNKISKILLYYIDKYKNKNALLYYTEDNNNFLKYTYTLSLPIDEAMFNELNLISLTVTPKQRIFLSHPLALRKNSSKYSHFQCTKENAIKIILQNTLINEKVIIFSQFIDVLLIYENICNQLNLHSILLTGKDKGNKQKQKLIVFENNDEIKVMLTTLQKTAEGFNFPFATHVIVMELWWNPWKIIQALSRVDRYNQSRNIFLYLLCYNHEGDIIQQDAIFYNKMVDKLDKANTEYSLLEVQHPKNNPYLKTQYKIIPEIKSFRDINTLDKDLSLFINQFIHTPKMDLITIDEKGYPLGIVKDEKYKQSINYLRFIYLLDKNPWLIKTCEFKEFLKWFYINKIISQKALIDHYLIKNLTITTNVNKKLLPFYQVIFIDIVSYRINYKYNKSKIIRFLYLLGKKKNGKIESVGIYYYDNNLNKIFQDIKNRGLKRIHVCITRKYRLNEIIIEMKKYINITMYLPCLSYIYNYITIGLKLENYEIEFIEKIFFTSTYKKARNLCQKEENKKSINSMILMKIINILPSISCLYKVKTKYRNTICTINIIKFIINLVNHIIAGKEFDDDIETIKYISFISEKILKNGKLFIPNWENIIKQIDL